MRRKICKILITGGAGFIASEIARQAIEEGYRVIVVDKLTYAGDFARLNDISGELKFYKADICNKNQINSIFKKENPDIVLNLAAETHVDRSILCSLDFLETNIRGTQVMLEASKKYGVKRYIQVSTDEVYGDITKGQFFESTPIAPSSPYSASKASADLFVRSYIRTYGFPAIIVRPSNNYGPWQYPEKFIPVIIYKALKGEKVPVYAKGQNIREWLHVTDCASAILKVVKSGRDGEVYNVGSGNERENIAIVNKILGILGKPQTLVQFVKDRPGHDLRYSLNCRKMRELGWEPRIDFDTGLKSTVIWYKENLDWLEGKVRYLRNYWRKVYKCQ